MNDLGFTWIKQQIEWKVFEPVPGQIEWGELDLMVNAADAHNVRVLFSVVKAPAWARTTGEEDGVHFVPPQALIVQLVETKDEGEGDQQEEKQLGRVRICGRWAPGAISDEKLLRARH